MSTFCAGHYSTILEKEGDPRHAEWKDKASKFYSQALQLLQDRTYPLPVRIGSLLDMRLGQLEHTDGKAANFLMNVGEFFIQVSGASARLWTVARR